MGSTAARIRVGLGPVDHLQPKSYEQQREPRGTGARAALLGPKQRPNSSPPLNQRGWLRRAPRRRLKQRYSIARGSWPQARYLETSAHRDSYQHETEAEECE